MLPMQAGLDSLSRRDFLRRSAWLAAAAAGGRVVTACTPGAKEIHGAALSASNLTILAAVADAIIPRGGAFALGAADVNVAARLDLVLAQDDAVVQEQVSGALLVIEWLALPWQGGRFTRLGEADRAAFWQKLLDSRVPILRRAAMGLARGVNFAFYTAEPVWPLLGYDGPLVPREATP